MASLDKKIKIGERTIGDGKQTFVIAEMSGNHGGSIERALDIIRAAKRAGADAIKLQTYTADTITLKSNLEDFVIPKGSPWEEYSTLWDLYNKAFTPWEWHKKLFLEARGLGIEIFSSPFDESAVDFLEDLNVSAYKIASPEITHIPLITKIAQTRKPVIISTGIADLSDINLALSTLKAHGSKDIILLKCSTSYPAPIEESNLLTIPDMVDKFGCLSGLSDHTKGSLAAITSVALGATVIEKHFTLDKLATTVDSFFSLSEEEFSAMVKDIRLVEKSLGKVNYDITESAKLNLYGRRSIYVSSKIKKGGILTKSNIKVVRPSFGLHPKYYTEVLGRFANQDLSPGERLTWDVLDDHSNTLNDI